MPSITLAGTQFTGVERYEVDWFKVAAEHDMVDGTYRVDVYGAKRRWRIGWDYMTSSQLASLKSIFNTGGTMTFVDLEGSSYTVMFEGPTPALRYEPRVDVPWASARYKVDIVLRQV